MLVEEALGPSDPSELSISETDGLVCVCVRACVYWRGPQEEVLI